MNDTPIYLSVAERLLKSRRFWLTTVGVVTSLVLFAAAKVGAATQTDAQAVINIIQPLIALLIVVYTVDDTANKILSRGPSNPSPAPGEEMPF